MVDTAVFPEERCIICRFQSFSPVSVSSRTRVWRGESGLGGGGGGIGKGGKL